MKGIAGRLPTCLTGRSCYTVALPAPRPATAGEPRVTVFTKAHSGGQPCPGLHAIGPVQLHCRSVCQQVRAVAGLANSAVHTIVGSGSNDPAKYGPDASRETLDHSRAYRVAVALEGRAASTTNTDWMLYLPVAHQPGGHCAVARGALRDARRPGRRCAARRCSEGA